MTRLRINTPIQCLVASTFPLWIYEDVEAVSSSLCAHLDDVITDAIFDAIRHP